MSLDGWPRVLLWGIVLAAAAAAAAAAPGRPAPGERRAPAPAAGQAPAMPTEPSASWRLVRGAGTILDAAPTPAAGPLEGCLLALTAPGEPRARRGLLALCARGDAIEVVAPGQAPDGAEALAAAVVGAETRVMFGVPGGVDEAALDAGGRLRAARSVLRDVRIHPRSLDDRPDLDGDGRDDLLQSLPGGLGAWRRLEDGAFRPLSDAELAGTAVTGMGRVELRGRDFAPGVPERAVRWASPVTERPDRLSIPRVPLTPDGAGEPCTAWLRPGDVRRVTAWVVAEAPVPTLVAATLRADRADLLGEHRLLVAPLECDDTGRGRSPWLDLETPYPNFDPPRLELRDVTGDGLPDVIAVGVAGRFRPRLMASVWRALPQGSFARRPRRWSRRVERATQPTADWTEDVTGDDRSDMIVLDEAGATVYAGRPADGRSVPLADKPAGRHAWSGTLASPRLIGYVRSPSGSRPVVVGERLTDDAGTVDRPLLVLAPRVPAPGE